MTRSRKRQADSAQSKTPRMSGHSTRENREPLATSAPDGRRRPVGEGHGRTADMHVARESDEGIVPTNAPNKPDAEDADRACGARAAQRTENERFVGEPRTDEGNSS